MNNTRFATAIHILTILSENPDEWMTSDWIAGSINVNPVVVRKEISVLKNARLLESRQGKEGGVRLNKNSNEIQISEIYEAVKNTEVLGKKNKNPNPQCPVGKQINENLDVLFQETDQIVFRFLENKTLKDFAENFK